MIDRNTAERIKDAANIVEVVSDYVHLVRRGSNFMGLCPFHNERTPSFSVSPRRNMCYCFSCHKGGSPVNFIMEKEGINYHDALLHLAKKYGIPVEERQLTDEERRQQSRREGMLVANEWAMNEMQRNLTETDEGRDVGLQYFSQRGLTDEAIKAFRLGYALDRPGALQEAARKAGIDLETLKSVGLVGTSQQGHPYDRFRGRVIFPVLNPAGKVVAFGGRDLKGGPAKYVNSPESDIYKKSRELYGIYQAKGEIVRQDKCFLVEGYMDVIGMWQSGMRNVIASSGTALTDGQIALIHRFTDNITLLYDGDAAGIKASLRGIDMLLSHKMKVKVLLLPDGHDPDSFARVNTPEEFREYVEKHETDIIRFKAEVLMKDAASDPLRRSEAVKSVVQSLACIPDPITANIYIQECAALMGVDETLISRETARYRSIRLEQLRTERRQEQDRRRIGTDIDRTQPARQPSAGRQEAPAAQTVQSEETKAPSVNPLTPLERQVIRYCVRYGMMDFCEGNDAEGNPCWLNLAEYVDAELRADYMDFSTPLFRKILDEVMTLKERFYAEFDRMVENQAPVVEQRRREKIAELATRDLDMDTLAREEQKMEDALSKEAHREQLLFAADFTGRVLSSHEDDDVRRFAIECMNDIQPLSRRFEQMASSVPEYERLIDLIPRAMTEWRQGIIRGRIEELMVSLRQAQSDGDTERLETIMKEISGLHRKQAKIAKGIGERVISPRGLG